jgi:hypothetical protein
VPAPGFDSPQATGRSGSGTGTGTGTIGSLGQIRPMDDGPPGAPR